LLAAACIVVVAIQAIVPGKPWYHSSSYALLVVALNALLWWRLRKLFAQGDPLALPITVAGVGALLSTVVGLSAGLLGPDTQTYAGAPGAVIPIGEPSGNLRFPSVDPTSEVPIVRFESSRGHTISVPPNRRRYVGAFVMWSAPHPVAALTAEDLHRRRVTITQPTNASFLSPVLLFSQSARIGGRMLPVDSFSLPAEQRVVKVVLFSAATLSEIRHHPTARPALLVAVEDERARMLPGAIRLLPSGERVTVGGVIIGAVIADYPQIVVAAAPDLPILLLGVAFFLAGALWYATLRSRSRS